MTKINQIQTYLKENNLDIAFITTPDNVFYFSQFKSNPHERLLGVMIFQEATSILVCPKMEVPDAINSGWSYDVIGHLDTDQPFELIKEKVQLNNISVSNIAIEKSHLTVERLESLQQVFPQANFVRLDEKINEMRVIKDDSEIEKMRYAAQLADYAIEVGCKEIAEGKTEMEILTVIENAIKEKGCKMSFDTMVLSGPKSASPHGKPGGRKIQKGDFILFDLGVEYEGYCSDITRTVAFGSVTDAQKEIYQLVRSANEKAIEAVKPGVRAMDIDKIARDIITDGGFGEDFTHRLGHGLGISVHEYPSVTGTNEMQLKSGMVFTIEPGIYNNIAGVRIEDDVVVTENGVEVLTKYPKELIIL
ncbi:M24 family metallopeptidase [Ureibacillus manganicus]|uniref:Metallopeptidase n=1 Tax=Ureibacillus manganicus DSM 26584 TaxID=1384049 RepID=A0A0A3HYG5_9BACL|nr:Xaa-Pro peptidase family protein [Ureibacillus manganicus]KGR77504.1 metallopeptidase [Ureibacillus manganicus DSM 26584]